tara:strand:- start:43 stop:711 length:669 start_codon:yes stop_codon:yes gene_type:complete
MSDAGIVYIAASAACPNMIKIGQTSGEHPEEVTKRMKDLSRPTGVPLPILAVVAYVVPDYIALEKIVHAELENLGFRINKEWFREDTLELVKSWLKSCSIKEVTPVASYDKGEEMAVKKAEVEIELQRNKNTVLSDYYDYGHVFTSYKNVPEEFTLINVDGVDNAFLWMDDGKQTIKSYSGIALAVQQKYGNPSTHTVRGSVHFIDQEGLLIQKRVEMGMKK